jgi:hypothetical protein
LKNKNKKMVTVVDNFNELSNLQNRLTDIFKSNEPEYINALIGYQGGAEETLFLYFAKYDFWTAYMRGDVKHWNGFGIGRPKEGKVTSITCEINFPYEGINRRIAGAFGKEGDEVVILHRGKIGGGRKGIGKNLFFENYRGEFIQIGDGNIESSLALIGNLNSQNLLGQISTFVHEVERIKNFDVNELQEIDDDDEVENSVTDFDFRAEGYGKRNYTRKDEIEAISNHGIIINTLAEILKNKGLQIGNDRKRDLFTIKNNKIDKIFEAKTDLSNSSIYSAVGQVLMYSAEKNLEDNMKILVLPEKLNQKAEQTISKLGLDILYFHFEGDEVIFREVERFSK